MTLRLALRIDGDARGAKEAASGAAREVEKLGKAADGAYEPIGAIEAHAKRAGVSVNTWREGMKHAAENVAKMRAEAAAAKGALGDHAKRVNDAAAANDNLSEKTKENTAATAQQRAMVNAMAQAFSITGGPAGQLAGVVSVLTSGSLKFNVAAVASAAVLGAITAAAISAAAAYAKLEAQQATLANTLRATNGAARQSQGDLNHLAEELSRSGTQSTESIRGAIQDLLRFSTVAGANFPKVMKAAQDLSNAFGGDLRSNVRAFGRAFDDPINGLDDLRAAGLRISPVQQKLIADLTRAGELTKAWNEILRLASEQLGGSTAKSADTTSAAYGRLSNAAEHLFEVLGKSTDFGLKSFLDWLAKKADEAAAAMERLQKAESKRQLTPFDQMRMAAGMLPKRPIDRVGVQFDEFFPGAGTEAKRYSDLSPPPAAPQPPPGESPEEIARRAKALGEVTTALKLEAETAGMTATAREAYIRSGEAMALGDKAAREQVGGLVNEIAALRFMAQDKATFTVQIESLRIEAAVFGLAAGAAAAYRYENEKLAQAKAAGITLSDAQIAKIREEAGETGKLTQNIFNLNSAKQAADSVGGAMTDALFNWASGARTASEAIRDLAMSIGRMLVQAALLGQGGLAGILGTSNSGGLLGGLLKSVFSFAGGKAKGGYITAAAGMAANDNFAIGARRFSLGGLAAANDNFARGIVRRAPGGMVRGPGTTTSDSIKALLSDGEFVVNARSTAKNRSLLEAVNSGMAPPPMLPASPSLHLNVEGTTINVAGSMDKQTAAFITDELDRRDRRLMSAVVQKMQDATSRGEFAA
ncbi:MAG: phage tail length tape measure family protein [Rhizobiales bacterium]|nr:phage tail length tape measure family protein [Hyphomicrobiales bacterium]